MSKELIYKGVEERKNFIDFSFQNNEAIVSINRSTYKLSCNCHNGSNAGINNKQLCYHKKFIIEKFGLKIDQVINKKSILNIKNGKK